MKISAASGGILRRRHAEERKSGGGANIVKKIAHLRRPGRYPLNGLFALAYWKAAAAAAIRDNEAGYRSDGENATFAAKGGPVGALLALRRAIAALFETAWLKCFVLCSAFCGEHLYGGGYQWRRNSAAACGKGACRAAVLARRHLYAHFRGAEASAPAYAA